MRIEEGKFYRAANGEKIGPMMEFGSGRFPNSFIRKLGDGFVWSEDGECSHNAEGEVGPYHIISEWTEGPVRTVTRQEIIPGTYDGVCVGEVCNVPDCAEPDNPARVEVFVSLSDHLDADELERAAAVLTALAGALRDGN